MSQIFPLNFGILFMWINGESKFVVQSPLYNAILINLNQI